MTPLSVGSNVDRGRAQATAPISTHRNVLMLADGPKVLSVPADARFAMFASTGDIWVDYLGHGDADVIDTPTGDVTDGSAPDFNPQARFLETAVARIIVASASADDGAMVTIQFYGAA